MTEKVLKAYIKDKYFVRVKRAGNRYYTLSFMYDSGGGYWRNTETYDRYGEILANRLFVSLAEIIDAIEGYIKTHKNKKGNVEYK